MISGVHGVIDRAKRLSAAFLICAAVASTLLAGTCSGCFSDRSVIDPPHETGWSFNGTQSCWRYDGATQFCVDGGIRDRLCVGNGEGTECDGLSLKPDEVIRFEGTDNVLVESRMFATPGNVVFGTASPPILTVCSNQRRTGLSCNQPDGGVTDPRRIFVPFGSTLYDADGGFWAVPR